MFTLSIINHTMHRTILRFFKSMIILMGLSHLLFSCEVNKNPDVSNIEVELNTVRFDRLLFNMDTTDVKQSFQELESEHKAFTDIFFKHILPLKGPLGQPDQKKFEEGLSKFVNDDFTRSLYDTAQIVYPDLKSTDEQIVEMLKYAKYYFPDINVSRVYTYISEFGYQTFLFTQEDGSDAVGVGLDLFLDDYPYKLFAAGNPSFSAYISRAFNKDHIPKKVAEAIIDDLFQVKSGERLLDKMMENGKKLLMLEKFLPHTQDSIIFEYTKEQMDWIKSNEANVWVHLLSEDLLYETNRKKTRSLIEVSPTSKGMPQESPGRTANYIGYKILKKFQDRNPNISLDSLIQIKDAQYLLDNARYKPSQR